MKVLDLHCVGQHAFEGWFASERDFQAQSAAGQIACPTCGDTRISKKISAPRLNMGAMPPLPATRADGAPVPQDASAAPPELRQLQAAMLRLARQVVAHSENVGDRFADEARRIHHGEAPERAIRGQASIAETYALLEEGIAVLPLPEGAEQPLH
ncbi:MAG TPA: DUF1178 family protein [Burkholderiaceae bacterium]